MSGVEVDPRAGVGFAGPAWCHSVGIVGKRTQAGVNFKILLTRSIFHVGLRLLALSACPITLSAGGFIMHRCFLCSGWLPQ